jgi:hypothetical protein
MLPLQWRKQFQFYFGAYSEFDWQLLFSFYEYLAMDSNTFVHHNSQESWAERGYPVWVDMPRCPSGDLRLLLPPPTEHALALELYDYGFLFE